MRHRCTCARSASAASSRSRNRSRSRSSPAAVIVGPNGSGKSNIADAVVWAAGSLTPSELRAEKPDDVFAGGGDRKPAEHCEVELVFDNEDDAWPDLDFSEVSVARRLARGRGAVPRESRGRVRRTDLVEMLSDVGLGRDALDRRPGQGRAGARLEARGPARVRRGGGGAREVQAAAAPRRAKLARVALQVERAHDVEEEVRKRLRPLALQATAAERAEKLALEIAALRARIAQLDLADSAERARRRRVGADAAALVRRGAQSRLEGLLADRARAEDELSDAAGRREAAVAALPASGRLRTPRAPWRRPPLRSSSGSAARFPRSQAIRPRDRRRHLASSSRRHEPRRRLESRSASAWSSPSAPRSSVSEFVPRASPCRAGGPPAARSPSKAPVSRFGSLEVQPGMERAAAARCAHVRRPCSQRPRGRPGAAPARQRRRARQPHRSHGPRRRISWVSFRSWRSMRCSTLAFRR